MPRHYLSTILLTAVIALAAPLAAADGHDHAAEAKPLGSLVIGSQTIAIATAGGLAAGSELHVELQIKPEAPAPKAIRVWVGSENARGSAKAKAEAEKNVKGAYAAHVEVPKPIPADSKLWIAIEQADGQTIKGSLVLAPAPAPAAAPEHTHGPGDGHGH
jgi:hypothetical protein